MSAITERLSTALADRYRIERHLGAGGMATVYLAEDLKHKRKVAVKVLKPELAAVLGAERFVQEITTTASLSHPHILPLFDSGTADGFLFYVMPFIEGETLRDKLNRETQLGVDEAVKIATEVADALDYAHRHGVIHRDIKPENILLHDGRPMVADFGIALAVSAAAGGRMTETGLSLGTPHYMSPEQATAEKEITARSDVYSLASVLYEMLAGEPPHSGGSAQAIIMKIIAEPAQMVTKLRKSVPPNVASALAKALEKVPADRFASAKDFADALANRAFRIEVTPAHAGAILGGTGVVSRGAFAGVAIVALFAIAAAAWGWMRPPPVTAPARYQLSLFDRGSGAGPDFRSVALSPDGRSIAFAQVSGGEPMVWLKTTERATAEPLAGTGGGRSPTFSTDGEWIAFVAGGRVRKVRRSGGDVLTIADGAPSGNAQLAWLDDGTVLFSGPQSGLMAVNEDGGPVRTVIPRDSLPNNVFDIAAVPGSRTALLVTCASNCVEAQLWAVDLATGRREDLGSRAHRVWHLDGGVVVLADQRAGSVLAALFDERRLAFRAPPTPVLEGVQRAGGENIAVAVSDNGTLLFAPARESGRAHAVWISRDGTVASVDSAWSFANARGAALSPDGNRLAIAISSGDASDLWLRDLVPNGGVTRLTFDGRARIPQWSADGASVFYVEVPAKFGGGFEVKRRRIDGSDSAQTVLRSVRDISEFVLLRDTTRLLVRYGAPPTRDIYLARRAGDAAADSFVPLLASDRSEEVAISLSPDGKWLAYASTESERWEVYVVPFPAVTTGRWQVSLEGGRSPRWARSGRELFFRDLNDGLLAVPVTFTTSPVFGPRRRLFRLEGLALAPHSTSPMLVQFDVSPDDRRFLFMSALDREQESASAGAVLVQNWLAEVKQRMKGTR